MKYHKIVPIFFAMFYGFVAHTHGQQVLSTNNSFMPDTKHLKSDGSINTIDAFTGSLNVSSNELTKDARIDVPRLSEMSKTLGTEAIAWSALGTGLDGFVFAIAVSGSDVYVGGMFSTAGGSSANRIAKWNGGSWSALGTGLNGNVFAIAVSGSDVYVGGGFTTAGGISANRIAKWDGIGWSALGSGLNGEVSAIAVSGSDVYVGGIFTTADGSSANNIAKWNGSSWSALGSGFDNSVQAIAVSGSDVYVGGGSASHIAKWNGSSWSALGTGLNGDGTAIAISGSDVYVGGGFSTAGGISANRIAKWDGSNWSALGTGLNGNGNAIAVSGSDVYVGGGFSTAGGISANYIAKWDGSNWAALGGGTNSYVTALRVNSSVGIMLVGGYFSTVDGSISAREIASFTDSQNPLPVELTSFKAYSSGRNIHLYWQTATEINNYGFNVERRVSLPDGIEALHVPDAGAWQTVGFVSGHGTSSTPRSYSFFDHSVDESGWYYYRLKQLDRDGRYSYSQIVEVNISSPQGTTLSQNYPNPVFPASILTVIDFSLDRPGHTSLEIYSNLGIKVMTLIDGELTAGEHKVPVHIDLPAGWYMYRLQTPASVLSRQMVVYR
ncbi:MAG: hypothetical protein WC824_02085 [Bacteroidota bacterium]|jgi:hypothetical protein